MEEFLQKLKSDIGGSTVDGLTEAFNLISSELLKNKLISPDKINITDEIKKHKIKHFKTTDELTFTYARLVMPEDLNPANTLFGGRLLQWIDEVGVIYIWDKWKEKKIVTTEIQNVYFLCSPKSGDIIKFYVETLEERKASVWLRVTAINTSVEGNPVVIDTHVRFAFLDRIKK